MNRRQDFEGRPAGRAGERDSPLPGLRAGCSGERDWPHRGHVGTDRMLNVD
jgi:hypothetical protein